MTYAGRSGADNGTGTARSWLRTPAHRAWLLGQAQHLLDFFRASVDETGHFVELDDDGRPLHARVTSASVPSQNLLTVARSVHSYALGELLGVPGCGPIVDQGHRKFWDFAGAHLIDHVRGGWYPELDPDNHRKVGPWYGKPDLYHALQACLLPLLPPSPSLAGALRSAPPAL